MEDRRIQKTKTQLQKTLLVLLEKKPFEKINVTEICKAAGISRITFYAHYNDKNALADDLFSHYTQKASNLFHQKQLENNPNDDSIQSYCNILDTILDILIQNHSFFSIMSPDRNPYLCLQLYTTVLKTIEQRTIMESHHHTLRYSPRQITGFLCYGLAGFLNESLAENMSRDTIRAQARKLLMDTLRSDAIIVVK
ncbi:MAG: TetR/AcrR family transcriptional regulator [Bulleidia sp.]